MVRKNLLIGAALAAALLAGCSGTSNDGNASAGDTTPSSTSSSASSAESTTTSTSTSTTSSSTSSTASTSADDSTEATADDDTAAEDTGSVQPAALDEQSKVWFGTFCTGLTGAFTGMTEAMGGAMSGAGTGAATDPKATQAALVSGYQQVAAAFSDTASNLSGLPAPTVDGGDEIATQLPGALNALGEGFATATEKFAAAEVTDEASLTAAMDAFTAETEQYGQQLETEFSGLETTLTPEIGAAVQALPECAMMGS